MIMFLQINLGGGRAAQNLAFQTAAELGADFIIASEYYKFGSAHQSWYQDRSQRAAIVPVTNTPMDDVGGALNDGYVWVAVGGIRVYACYWSPNTRYSDFEDFLRRLENSVRSSPVPVVVAGDFNAKHRCWSSPVNDAKGEALTEMAQSLDLVVCNHGPTPTREKDGHRSYIDVTLVSASLQATVGDWEVLQSESLSDHN